MAANEAENCTPSTAANATRRSAKLSLDPIQRSAHSALRRMAGIVRAACCTSTFSSGSRTKCSISSWYVSWCTCSLNTW